MKLRSMIAALLVLSFTPTVLYAMEQSVGWHRREDTTALPITVFHSTQSANLPTAQTIFKGEWQFEISHRFQPPFSAGSDALWGLDGPIYNRLGLSYGVTDRVMMSVLRSNLEDNLELGAKWRFREGHLKGLPYQLAVMGGLASNTSVGPSYGPGYRNREAQSYAQFILDALLADRLALGVVTSYLNNAQIADTRTLNEVTVGLNAQLYLARMFSVFTEWNASKSYEGLRHDALTFGLEIETGGHFFKLMASNSERPNPTQFLGGTPIAFTPHQWRFGFNLTRILRF
ncbi:MAG TPA: DUF5777 family beta-barrel protein [Candidatus Krumholzibacteria bacterium]|nr:DUF5777 family beta-barrel protein [Candidatus Krumholzibacteria bacterium]